MKVSEKYIASLPSWFEEVDFKALYMYDETDLTKMRSLISYTLRKRRAKKGAKK